jgi:hypothetical protein
LKFLTSNFRCFSQLFCVLRFYAKKLAKTAVTVVGPTLSMPKKTTAATPAAAFLCMFAYGPSTYH